MNKVKGFSLTGAPLERQQIERIRSLLHSFEHQRQAGLLRRALLATFALGASSFALWLVATREVVPGLGSMVLLLACLWSWRQLAKDQMLSGAGINCAATLHQLSEVGAPESFCEVRALRSVEPVASFLERFEATGRTQLLRGELNAIRKSIVFGKGDFL